MPRTLTLRGPFAFEAADDLADEIDSWLRRETLGTFCHRGTVTGKLWGVLESSVELTSGDLKRLCKSLGKRYTAEVSGG